MREPVLHGHRFHDRTDRDQPWLTALDRKEKHTVLLNFRKMTTPDGKKASSQEWDSDGDGFISKAEFAAKYSAEDGGGSQDLESPSESV